MDGEPSALDDALRAAPDLGAACLIVVEHLAAMDGLMPSVYVARGGRLRCQAVRGYWQILDGMPPSAGVIGRTFRTAKTTLVADTTTSDDYLEVAPGVHAEACTPIVCAGTVVGVVNVESPTTFMAAGVSVVEELERCARLLGAHMHRRGWSLEESGAQRLVRHAVQLSALSERAAIEAETLEAACDIGAMDSAMLLLADPPGSKVRAGRARGPLAEILRDAPRATIEAISAYVESGTSCYTVGERGGEEFPGMASLRSAGAQALVAVALGPDLGVLVLADRRDVEIRTEVVELLELLAAQAAGCLRTARAVAELRERAARDPLTGLGHHGTFHEALRKARPLRNVAVLLADIDDFKQINDTLGHQAGDRVLRESAAVLSGALRAGDTLFRIGGDEFAALVSVTTPAEAMDAGRRLQQAARAAGSGGTLSIGVAIPEPGESDASVLARADQALYAVKARGRDGVALAPALGA